MPRRELCPGDRQGGLGAQLEGACQCISYTGGGQLEVWRSRHWIKHCPYSESQMTSWPLFNRLRQGL